MAAKRRNEVKRYSPVKKGRQGEYQGVEVVMGKKDKSKGNAWLFHERNFPHRPRLSPKAVAQVKDSIQAIMSELMLEHGRDFVAISIYDVRLGLRQGYDMFLTYRQVGYFMRKLVEEGVLEKEVHNLDRTAKHWSDQYSRYRFTQRPPVDPNDPPVSVLGPDPGR
ncbi:hypothetical protein ES705_50517 [subsurface metagenome]